MLCSVDMFVYSRTIFSVLQIDSFIICFGICWTHRMICCFWLCSCFFFCLECPSYSSKPSLVLSQLFTNITPKFLNPHFTLWVPTCGHSQYPSWSLSSYYNYLSNSFSRLWALILSTSLTQCLTQIEFKETSLPNWISLLLPSGGVSLILVKERTR